MSIANTSLQNFGSTANGNTQRPVQEMHKSCIHAINNGGPVVPATPCDRTNTNFRRILVRWKRYFSKSKISRAIASAAA